MMKEELRKELNKVVMGFVAAIVTIILMIIFNVPHIYKIIIILIFAFWAMIPNKYFYVSSRELRLRAKK